MKDITRYEWECYREVQKSGLYNMLTPDAIRASGLDRDTYFDIVKNYNTYYEKFEGDSDE
ncbi:MAG: hypothetical protein Unbinned2990contig1002_29 [Prokaryotic dsDNA virus sp.]|nr:MAG: hypothetical protein Unbinned2990contig1002_29 [Prokaryotic dsDNA virus sp.]|tara:strand:+ start:11700 stop:11879 length:180 start_codon:yes stop_codon:yes gene_type:complete